MKILQLDIEGFRSLKKVSWKPGDLNVIIGPNGTGKSNLLRFLEMISVSAQKRLGKYIQSLGGMEPIVWDGEVTAISFKLRMQLAGNDWTTYILEFARLGGGSSYRIESELLADYNQVVSGKQIGPVKFLERYGVIAYILDEKSQQLVAPEETVLDEESFLSIVSGPFLRNNSIKFFQEQLATWSIYHDILVHQDAGIRQPAVARFEKRVDPDGQNLIPVLHTLYTGERDFKKDIDAAMRAAFGDDFDELIFPPAADQRVQLRIRWKSLKREQSAADLSDGTLRFLLLLTILASPSPPPLIAIDEPETGLHPSMLPIIAEYAVDAATRTQVVFTTHSPQFLDAFTDTKPTTTVAKWENGETTIKVLAGEQLDYWLKEYSLGALFKSGELEGME
ncbi:AAA family ATPase [candidate division KSB1 bacterium]|nr:AAA family ATPase [candidate division KSB1 bacterium]